MATRRTITNGPSKFDLMNALPDGDSKNRRTIKFTILEENGPNLLPFISEPITINRLEPEDGSGESWLFEGWYGKNREVKGYFRTDERRGWIEFFNE